MLRLSRAAALLGVAPATLRSYCERGLLAFQQMPNGERQFRRADLLAFKSGERKAHHRASGEVSPTLAATNPVTTAEGRRRVNWEEEVPPWERRVHSAKAEIEVERARQEVDRLRAGEAAELSQAEAAKELARAQHQEASRLLSLKQHGRTFSFFSCGEVERQVVRDLEAWVTSANVPVFLAVWEQRRLVSDYAQAQATAYDNARREVEMEAARELCNRELAQFTEAVRRKDHPPAATPSPPPAGPAKPPPCPEDEEDRILEAREERYQTMRNMRALARLIR